MLITEQYRQQQAELHAVGNYGTASLQYGETVADLLAKTGATSLLDYGCGSKRSLLKVLKIPPDLAYEGYDPAVPEYAVEPMPAELVCCIDVLEHIEPALLENVLEHLASLCDPYGFFAVHTGPAGKLLSDGRNAHLTQQPFAWWLPRLSQRFEVITHSAIPSGFAVLVRSLRSTTVKSRPTSLRLTEWSSARSRSAGQPPRPADVAAKVMVLKVDGHRLSFPPPADDQSDWARLCDLDKRVTTWLQGLEAESGLLELGAGYGARTIYASAARECRVLCLESMAARQQLLLRAIELNGASEKVRLVDPARLDDAKAQAAQCHHVIVDAMALSSEDLDGVRALVGAAPRNSRVLVRADRSVAWHRELLQWLEDHGLRDSEGLPVQPQPSWRAMERAQLTRAVTIVLPSGARARSVLDHVCRRVARAEVVRNPFPYAVIDEILPPDYYAEAVSHFPKPAQMRPISETGRVSKNGYPERHVTLFAPEDFAALTEAQARFWTEFSDWMYSDVFLQVFVSKFQSDLEPRLKNILAAERALLTRGDALLVNDHTQFKIGPHTDAPHRLVTFLFYMPKDESMRGLGTSIYRPKDPDFVCWGGPHHRVEKFDLVDTVEFMPNRLLTFPKTEKSFHGVEQIGQTGVVRPLLINNIRLLNKVTH